MATPTFSICPFTFKAIDTIHPEDLAVVYESNPLLVGHLETARKIQCGHSSTLSNLVSYLHDAGGTKLCPVCQSSPASFICDDISSSTLSRQKNNAQHIRHGSDGTEGDDSGGRIVSFRYGTHVYFLWVTSPPHLSSSYTSIFRDRTRENALDRIARVLRVDVKNGMKVIHKGRILYPHKNDSVDDISKEMLDISASDIIHHRKKPSLVVMGLRMQTSDTTSNTSLSDMKFSVARQISLRFIWNTIARCFQSTFISLSTLVGGMVLFVRSILVPPQTP